MANTFYENDSRLFILNHVITKVCIDMNTTAFTKQVEIYFNRTLFNYLVAYGQVRVERNYRSKFDVC